MFEPYIHLNTFNIGWFHPLFLIQLVYKVCEMIVRWILGDELSENVYRLRKANKEDDENKHCENKSEENNERDKKKEIKWRGTTIVNHGK